jgi:hypothetical protein
MDNTVARTIEVSSMFIVAISLNSNKVAPKIAGIVISERFHLFAYYCTIVGGAIIIYTIFQ